MAKIMLVEDDNNLREIYEARLLAEGYEIVSAKDGEEALALAVKERPDLIISDVMMPKISGFDMLDILRSTPETKDTKVIMMTALSQAEDKTRADKLGADRYLVKSQVTLEDVAKVAREVLQGDDAPAHTTPVNNAIPTAPPPAPASTIPVTNEPPAAAPVEPPGSAIPTPLPVSDTPTTEPPAIATPAPADDPIPVQEPPAVDDVSQAAATADKLTDVVNDLLSKGQNQEASDNSKESDNASSRKRIIQPINDISDKPDLNALLEKENTSSQTPPVTNSVITPDSPPNTQPAPNTTANPTTQQDVQQTGHDPNSIAL